MCLFLLKNSILFCFLHFDYFKFYFLSLYTRILKNWILLFVLSADSYWWWFLSSCAVCALEFKRQVPPEKFCIGFLGDLRFHDHPKLLRDLSWETFIKPYLEIERHSFSLPVLEVNCSLIHCFLISLESCIFILEFQFHLLAPVGGWNCSSLSFLFLSQWGLTQVSFWFLIVHFWTLESSLFWEPIKNLKGISYFI